MASNRGSWFSWMRPSSSSSSSSSEAVGTAAATARRTERRTRTPPASARCQLSAAGAGAAEAAEAAVARRAEAAASRAESRKAALAGRRKLSSAADMQEEACCPICLEFLKEPVTLDCGHNFCRGCITDYCDTWEGLGDLECPVCRAELQKGNLRSNWQLAALVEKIKQNLLPASQPREQDLCSRHEHELSFFCKEDEKLLCQIGKESPEHRGHSLLNLEEAAHLYKDQIGCCLKTLRNEKENILASKAATEQKSQEMLIQTRQEQEKTADIFKQFHSFLEVEERILLAQMKEVDKEIGKERDKHLASLSEELFSLESIISEMEEKCQQSASELLKDVRSTLQRYEEKKKVGNPVFSSLALQWRILDFCDIHLFLDSTIKEFTNTMNSGLHLQKANVTLDPDTAHPHLILSENSKSVRVGKDQNLPYSSERFEKYGAVLGWEDLTAGRHFWEVLVGSEGEWSVGVARLSVKRVGVLRLIPKEGIWQIGKWRGSYKASEDDSSPPLTPSGELKKIRVWLNYAAGRVAFFDANTGDLLYEFSGVSFFGKTLLPFFWVRLKGHLTISS